MNETRHSGQIILPELPLTLAPSRKGEKRLYVLGADDPENEEIIFYLTRYGCAFEYAMFGGNRVNPGNAYQCDPVACENGVTLVFVECRPRDFLPGEYYVTYADHHNEGDAGFNKPPSEFLLGSSLGQISILEGHPLTEYQLAVAALDHCPAQAMRGLCPGIDPKRAKIVYQEATLRRRNVTLPELHACMNQVELDMAAAKSVAIGKDYAVDLTQAPTGYGYSLRYICSIGVAAEAGVPLLISNRNYEQGPEKRILTGLVTPQLVSDFRGDYAPRYRLIHVWGDNNRGAGGLLP